MTLLDQDMRRAIEARQSTQTETCDPVAEPVLCEVPGCPEPYFCQGVCRKHYGRTYMRRWRAIRRNPVAGAR